MELDENAQTNLQGANGPEHSIDIESNASETISLNAEQLESACHSSDTLVQAGEGIVQVIVENKESARPAGQEFAKHCLECSQPINTQLLSFEMRLVDIDFLCRRCFDRLLAETDAENMPHLDNPFLMRLRR